MSAHKESALWALERAEELFRGLTYRPFEHPNVDIRALAARIRSGEVEVPNNAAEQVELPAVKSASRQEADVSIGAGTATGAIPAPGTESVSRPVRDSAQQPPAPAAPSDTPRCEHDKRFGSVFLMPPEDHGCVACMAERLSRELSALRAKPSWDKIIADLRDVVASAKQSSEAQVVPEDVFNCPKCGAHDWGLNKPNCPHCYFAAAPSGKEKA